MRTFVFHLFYMIHINRIESGVERNGDVSSSGARRSISGDWQRLYEKTEVKVRTSIPYFHRLSEEDDGFVEEVVGEQPATAFVEVTEGRGFYPLIYSVDLKVHFNFILIISL